MEPIRRRLPLKCKRNLMARSGLYWQREDVDEFRSSLWRHLPDELLEMVFGKMALAAFVKFRCLNKLWKKRIEAFAVPFLVCHCKPLQLSFSPGRYGEDLRGVEEPLLFLKLIHEYTAAWEKERLPLPFPNTGIRLLATDGGLLCFRSGHIRKSDFIIYNPLTKKWRSLSPPHSLVETDFVVTLVGLAMTHATGSYKLLVSGWMDHFKDGDENDADSLTDFTILYDSSTHSWGYCAPVPEVPGMEDGARGWGTPSFSVCSSGNLYWGFTNEKLDVRGALLKYNVLLNKWTYSITTQMEDAITDSKVLMLNMWPSLSKIKSKGIELYNAVEDVEQRMNELGRIGSPVKLLLRGLWRSRAPQRAFGQGDVLDLGADRLPLANTVLRPALTPV